MQEAYLNFQKDRAKSIQVNGKAKIAVEPDTVIVSLEVYTEELSLGQAQQENAQNMEKVIHALLKHGVGQPDIQTTVFTVYPIYDYVEEKQVFRGFAVSNELTISSNDIEAAGEIVDTAINNGANRISEIRFSIDNQAYFYKQALIMALEDAVSKSLAIAEKMQLRLAPYPVKIDEITNEPPQMHGQAFALANKNTTPIEPGKIVIAAEVNVQFQY
ncbi:SIMPL domain-containing protein [Virgibacillus halophilus]|uniref:SIMPL domain-containing protein n=1 Tax=Tigheibacillus halophilus TaxID=361280 RepID=A0ABU5CC62_9BACI|nr:SIMPL domain-containing protein [Virgibacillus halophilus]